MSEQASLDARLMSRAIELAERGLWTTDPNPRVGCVIARGGDILGEGWHARAGGAHAEVEALAMAGQAAKGATAYVTLEPCCHQGRTPPCTQALLAAGIARLVYAVADPDPRINGGGHAQLAAAGLQVEAGIGAVAARKLNRGFFSRLQRQRPWLRLKLAISLDGRTALASGDSQWISGEAARHDVQQWRARSSAILTGAGTVRRDDPRLNVRVDGAQRQPRRLVLDSGFGLDPAARIFAGAGAVTVFGTRGKTAGEQRLREAGITTEVLPASAAGVDLAALMSRLAELELNEIQVECGATLAGGLLQGDWVDELVIYLAPVLLGPGARPLAELPLLQVMQDRLAFSISEFSAVGDDLRIVLQRRQAH